MSAIQAARERAVHLLRMGHTPKEVSAELNCSESWVRKCRRLYQTGGWAGLAEVSRAPHQHGRRCSERIRQAIIRARSELEAEAAKGSGLKYIGGRAIRTRLKRQRVSPLPSVSTIERVLRQAGLTRPKAATPQVTYPHLCPQQPHQLIQIDHLPHFLQGGQRVFCFNGIDVVSRYPSGQVYEQRRAVDAVDFLIHVAQTIGLATYTQVDNEGCFSGGFTHPGVIGQFARLALRLGTELVFSPVRYPQSNGSVERFHQDYQQHVWQDTYLVDRAAVQTQADQFFSLYRHSGHHSALADQTPHQVHHVTQPTRLAATFTPPAEKLPLYAGRLHFIRRVQADGTVSVLNLTWAVPEFDPLKGVWVTIDFRPAGATLTIYDDAPDVPERHCLASYPFPLKEVVLPRPDNLDPAPPPSQPVETTEIIVPQTDTDPAASFTLWRWVVPGPGSHPIARSSRRLTLAVRNVSTRLIRHLGAMMY